MYARRRRAVVLLLVLLVAVGVFVRGQFVGDDETAAEPLVTPTAAAASASARDVPPPDTADRVPGTVVAAAAGGFVFAGGYGPMLGSSGIPRRFKVAVESKLGRGDGGNFAAAIDEILGDRRSWIAGGQLRLRRVPEPAAAEFTIFLASAVTSERMCAEGGLRTEGYTSCRLPGRVIVNEDRWRDAVPGYGAPLAVYRAYAINHEVGHELGHGHEACAGAGRPAPVMMQQTYGLQGCLANAWPYLDGERYAGDPA